MAEGAVAFVLEKLMPFLEKQMELFSGAREEVAIMRGELERVRAFLRKADAMEEDDEEVKVWVKQIREAAHDIEDVLDESVLLMTHNHDDGLYGLLHRFSCCIRNVKARYRMVKEMRVINTRIKRICEGHCRLNWKFLAEEANPSGSCGWHDRGEPLLCDRADLVGIESHKKWLVDRVIHGTMGREVFSVVGTGGLGKTTLAKQVYDDPDTKKHFAIHAFVCVARPFRIEGLLWDLATQLLEVISRPVPKAADTMSSFQLKKLIKELLWKERYLIILDGVKSTEVWDEVKHALPSNQCGSRVLITTRHADVASGACFASDGEVYNLSPLPPDDSWTLFCKKTFKGGLCPPHLEEICRQILRKCEGLPLGIVAMSGVLATKDKRRIDEWEMVRRCLGAEIDGNDKLKNLKKVLTLSFNDLPYYLKSCFLYLGIFPEDRLVERTRLIRLWTVEGFTETRDGKSQESVAEDYFDELVNRSLIQAMGTTSDGRVKFCRIHDLLREVIILKSKEQNFAALAKEPNSTWQDKVRRLSIQNSLQNVQPNKSVSLLRSLFLFGIVEKPSLHKLFPGGFRLLNVLDMTGSPITNFPTEVMDLYHLKYISLRETKVRTIPSFIGKLWNLETLDLKDSLVTELPVEILGLRRLKNLLVYGYEIVSYAHFESKHGFKALEEIGELQQLQKLCYVEVNQGNSRAVLTNIGKLTQLTRLGIIKLQKEDGKILCESIEKLTNLRAISILSVDEHEVIDLEHLSSPPPLLQRLYLYGRLESIPKWIPYHHGLVKVFLKWSRLSHDPLEHLQDLPNLVHLELLQVYDGDCLCFKAGGFRKLKVLGLDKFDELRHMVIEPGSMKRVEKISIQRCKSMARVPFGIENLERLGKLEFFDMPYELIKTMRRDGGEDYWRVSHIPEVYSAYWREGKWKVYSLESFSGEDSAPQAFDAVISSEELHSRWK